ncbi:hypothetical protein DPMN_068877 [Dreissena polymorpha]|uniref:Uncharacterized protein n=1 Tax=Dreissena polymorpha TaxID=45954 RepID=A0A9D4BUI3_DREPO|nr:hypothetical protein DPMN_068877 [Dreissena polymorpha]
MDTSETEKEIIHPTSQSKYIKQAKNATSKANAEKQALNAIREKIELERVKRINRQKKKLVAKKGQEHLQNQAVVDHRKVQIETM